MLRLEGLHKSFGAITAVHDLSLTINRGEVFGLLGPNGAGKTTTINMIIGQLAPDRGRVELEGIGQPTTPGARRHLGLAPQDLALYEELTGEENLNFFASLYGLRGEQRRSRVTEVLQLVGLHDRRRSRVKTYSGGMQRRMNLAVALVHGPPLLLLDEPTAGVDPQSRNAILEFVRTLRAAGRTIVYTTHYMEEAQRLCDRVAIMDHGRLLALGTVPELLAQHGGESSVVLERAGGEEHLQTAEPKETLLRALQDESVLGVRVERANLESVFLHLTGRRFRD